MTSVAVDLKPLVLHPLSNGSCKITQTIPVCSTYTSVTGFPISELFASISLENNSRLASIIRPYRTRNDIAITGRKLILFLETVRRLRKLSSSRFAERKDLSIFVTNTAYVDEKSAVPFKAEFHVERAIEMQGGSFSG